MTSLILKMMIIGSDNQEDMDELKMFYDPMMPKETRWGNGYN